MLCFFSLISVSGQKIIVSASADTLRNRVKTVVSLIDIPQHGRARFQQRLPIAAKLVSPPLESVSWDTAHNVFTMTTVDYPHIDTLSFQFVCEMNPIPDTMIWGEAAFMFEDENKSVQKINTPAKKYIVRGKITDPNVLQKGMFYIQIIATKTPNKISDLSKRVHLQSGSEMIEYKTDIYYKYLIGHFSTKEAALKKLSYYRQYSKNAFIVAF